MNLPLCLYNTDGKCYTIKESWDIIHEDDFIADRATFAYNTSWDILIPVVEKIEQVNEGVPTQLSNISLFSNIDEVYKSVLGFIKLNTNN